VNVSGYSLRTMTTYVLIGLNVGVYAATSLVGGDVITTSSAVIDQFGQYNAAVFNGEVWRLLTAMFLHADVVHIFGNMFFLLIFGLRAEELFRTREYVLIYLLSGLAGGLLSLLMGPDMNSVGASGAIFGVFGATVIYIRRAVGRSMLAALMFAMFLLLMNVGPNVNVLAHVGGLGAGLLMGYLLASAHRRIVTSRYGLTPSD